jgi:hypothetical protein
MDLNKSRSWLIIKNILSLSFFYGTLILIVLALFKHALIMVGYADIKGNMDRNVFINFFDLINWAFMKYFLDNRSFEQIVNDLCRLIKNKKVL